MVSFASAQDAANFSKPIRIVLAGDSTVADYPAKHTNRGWGQYIGEHFAPGSVEVLNLAKPGRSTKTFIKEGIWQRVLDAKPDYVFIQFGHNDSHSQDKPESTGAATDYKDNLRRYVNEARGIGAKLVLVTPMVRRTVDAQGNFTDNLQPYADAMKEVATEKNVPLIDLHALSQALLEKLGKEGSAKMASKKGDDTHFNEKGARAMADLVIAGLPAVEPSLAKLLKIPPGH